MPQLCYLCIPSCIWQTLGVRPGERDQRHRPRRGLGEEVTEQRPESPKTLFQVQMLGLTLENQTGQVCAVKGPGSSLG